MRTCSWKYTYDPRLFSQFEEDLLSYPHKEFTLTKHQLLRDLHQTVLWNTSYRVLFEDCIVKGVISKENTSPFNLIVDLAQRWTRDKHGEDEEVWPLHFAKVVFRVIDLYVRVRWALGGRPTKKLPVPEKQEIEGGTQERVGGKRKGCKYSLEERIKMVKLEEKRKIASGEIVYCMPPMIDNFEIEEEYPITMEKVLASVVACLNLVLEQEYKGVWNEGQLLEEFKITKEDHLRPVRKVMMEMFANEEEKTCITNIEVRETVLFKYLWGKSELSMRVYLKKGEGWREDSKVWEYDMLDYEFGSFKLVVPYFEEGIKKDVMDRYYGELSRIPNADTCLRKFHKVLLQRDLYRILFMAEGERKKGVPSDQGELTFMAMRGLFHNQGVLKKILAKRLMGA